MEGQTAVQAGFPSPEARMIVGHVSHLWAWLPWVKLFMRQEPEVSSWSGRVNRRLLDVPVNLLRGTCSGCC